MAERMMEEIYGCIVHSLNAAVFFILIGLVAVEIATANDWIVSALH